MALERDKGMNRRKVLGHIATAGAGGVVGAFGGSTVEKHAAKVEEDKRFRELNQYMLTPAALVELRKAGASVSETFEVDKVIKLSLPKILESIRKRDSERRMQG